MRPLSNTTTDKRSGKKGRSLGLILLKWLAFTAILIFLVYTSGSWFMASQATKAQRKMPQFTPSSVGLIYEEVNFTSRDGSVQLKGWYINPVKIKGVVILVHGLDSEKADGEVGFLDLARRLDEHEVAVFLFDLRGHGESGEGKLSGGFFEQQDLLGAFDWLVNQGVEPHKIGVIGFSMGGAVTLLSAAQEPRLQAIVADSAFSDVRDMLSNEIPKRALVPKWLAPAFIPGITIAARLSYGIEMDKIVPEQAIAHLKYPILLIHSRADERIPFEQGLRLKTASADPGTTLWELKDTKHVKAFQSYPDEYVERVLKYFSNRWE